MVGWPECGELPVEGGGGDDEGHQAGDGDARQDAAPQGRGSHHASNACMLPVNTSGTRNKDKGSVHNLRNQYIFGPFY